MENEATNAGAMVTAYSAPSNVFPQPRYAIIDLGTNQTPVAFNNPGSVVVQQGSTFTYWTNGVSYTIPAGFSGVSGMNDSGVVVGATTNYITLVESSSEGPYFEEYYYPGGIWTPGGGSIAQLASTPANDFIYDTFPTVPGSLAAGSMTNGFGGASLTVTPAGIAGNGAVYGGVDELWTAPEGSSPIYVETSFAARLDSGIQPTPGDNVSWDQKSTVAFTTTNGTYTSFSPGVSANGVVLGYQVTVADDDHYDGGQDPFDHDGTPDPVTWVAYDGMTFHTLAYQPQCIASNNDIVGNDGGSTNVYLWTNYVLAATPVNGISGPINKWDRIVSGSKLWQTNQLSNLNDVVPDSSGWNYISAGNFNGAINDGGAIVGTATYSGSNTNIATGSHAVMLVPMDLVVQTTPTSGQYHHIDYPPLFPNDDGVGRGPSPYQSNPNPKGVFIALSADLTTTAVGTMTATIGGSGGNFYGTLTETAANSGVFVDADNIVTLTLSVGTTTSSTAVNTLNATVNSSSLGYNNVTISLVESGVESLYFYSPIAFAEIIFSNAYNPSVVNTAHVNLQLDYVDANLGEGITGPGPFSLSLSETSAGSGVFIDSVSGLTVTLTNFTGTNPGNTNTMVASFSNGNIWSLPLAITLTDTSTTPLDFTSFTTTGDLTSNYQGSNITPDDPTVTGDGVFYIRAKGASGLTGITVQTDVGSSQPVTFTPLTNDPTTLISGPLLIIPQSSTGPTSYSNITTLQSDIVAAEGSTPDTTNPFFQIIQDPIDLTYFLMKFPRPHVNMFIGQGVFNSPNDAAALINQYPHLSPATIAEEYTSATNNPAAVQAMADSNLKLQGCEVLATSVTSLQFEEAISKFYIMYVGCHGDDGVKDTQNNNTITPVPFRGITFADKVLVEPGDVVRANGTVHQYTLVFLNGCKTADTNTQTVTTDANGNTITGGPYSNQVQAMYTAFNCQAYVGWGQVVSDLKADQAGILFFKYLTTSTPTIPATTVQQAINDTMRDPSLQGFTLLNGDPDNSQLLAPQPAPKGGSITADQIATAPTPP